MSMEILAPVVALAASATQAAPPPVVQRAPAPMLIAWTAEELSCDGQPIAPTALRRPAPSLLWLTGVPPKPLYYSFTVAADGRPLDIHRTDAEYRAGSEDVAPSLAATRFASGAKSGCTVRYMPQTTPLSEAPVEALFAYTMAPTAGPLPAAGWARMATGTCMNAPRPAPLMRALPDFDALPATPGVRDWSMVGYDIDARGRPRHVRIVSGTGNAALDAASAKAMRQSRFTAGARTGCLYPFWRAPGLVEAPPVPEAAAFRRPDATCTERRDWVRQPAMRFPPTFSRRMVEGWAVVGYDIAPWGEVGNVRVLAAQPSEEFGRQAMEVVRAATVAPSPRGASGCVERVFFKLNRPGTAAYDQADPHY